MKKKGRKSNLSKEQEEAKKLKKVSIKDVSSGTAMQMCIETWKAEDFLDICPKEVPIEYVHMEYSKRGHSLKIESPKKFSEIAAIYHRTISPSDNIELRMVNVLPAEALKNLKAICEHYNINANDFAIQTIRLNKDGAILVFKLSLKDIPSNADGRVKVRVLAHTKISRDPELETKAKKVLSQFSLSKYYCQFHTEERKFAVCTRLEK
jgi:hypothetical protein